MQELKNRFAIKAAGVVLVVFLAAFASAAQQVTDSRQTLRATFVGMEQTLPNGNIVVVDTRYGENGVGNLGVVYLYDRTRGFVISALKGASADDRIGSGGITVLPNGDFVVNSPIWKSRQTAAVGAQTRCGADAGCAGETVGEANSLIGDAAKFAGAQAVNSSSAARSQTFSKSSGKEKSAPAAPGTLIYDGTTGATITFTGSMPRTFMGQGYNLAAGTTNRTVTAGQVTLVSAAAVNYTNVQLNIQFWGAYDSTASPVFSNALANYTFSLGSANLAANTLYTIDYTLPASLALPSATNQGIVFNFKGDTGAGLVNTENLTTALRNPTSPAIAVGGNATPSMGYYRNASGRTDFNYLSGDARNLGAGNGGVVFQLNGPAAPTAAMVSVGGRATTASGRGIRGVVVTLIDGGGNLRTTKTSAFGYYRFSDVATGETYVVSAKAKRYQFTQSSQVLNVEDDASGVNFIAQ